MKLRMRGSSIRLRLTQSEVALLRDTGTVEEVCDFGAGQRFRYALESRADAARLSASLDHSAITVIAPAGAVRDWAGNNETGIYGASGPVEIAIEKDFRCVSRAGSADDADAFPNPAAPC